MARLPIPGEEDWGEVLNDYLLVSHTETGTLNTDALDEADYVHTTGNETVDGTKTFLKPIINTGSNSSTLKTEIGNGTYALTAYANASGVEVGSKDGSRIRMNNQVRYDSSAFGINTPAMVLRETTDAADATNKGSMIEFQQYFTSGTHAYGLACDNYGTDFNIATTGHKRIGWILAHYQSPPSTGEGIHQHMNFETCKADFSTIVTRLQISYGEDVALVSFPNSNVKFFDNKEVRWGNGNNVITKYDSATSRFVVTGSDWNWGNNVYIQPSTGRLGIGVNTPSAPAHVQRADDGNAIRVQNTTATGNNSSNILSTSVTATSRILQATITGDTVARLSVEHSGKFEWGPGGSTARDTNFYRSAAGTLKTDGILIAANGLDAGSHVIANVANPTSAQDAATKNYVDSALGAPVAWQPSDYGYVAWSSDPVATSTNITVPTAGTAQVVRLKVTAGTISNIYVHVGTAGASLSNCYIAVYQGGTLLAQSSDQSTAWQTGGFKTVSISSQSVTAGFVDIVFWANGTTLPGLRATSATGATNGALSGTNLRFATANTSLTGTAPSTLGTKTASLNPYWVAVG